MPDTVIGQSVGIPDVDRKRKEVSFMELDGPGWRIWFYIYRVTGGRLRFKEQVAYEQTGDDDTAIRTVTREVRGREKVVSRRVVTKHPWNYFGER